MLKRKVTSRQRKHLLCAEAIHPDAERALQTLLNFARQIDGNDESLDEGEIEEALAEEAAALEEIEDIFLAEDDENDEDGDVNELLDNSQIVL